VTVATTSSTVRPPGAGSNHLCSPIHCEDEETVVRAHEAIRDFDDFIELDAEPTRSGWGYGFGFRDPEGNVWGVACKYGSEFDDRGGFRYP